MTTNNKGSSSNKDSHSHDKNQQPPKEGKDRKDKEGGCGCGPTHCSPKSDKSGQEKSQGFSQGSWEKSVHNADQNEGSTYAQRNSGNGQKDPSKGSFQDRSHGSANTEDNSDLEREAYSNSNKSDENFKKDKNEGKHPSRPTDAKR